MKALIERGPDFLMELFRMAMNEAMKLEREKNILEKMCGLEVSSSQVSDAAKTLDDEIKCFKERPLGQYSVLYVDAEYQRVRINGSVVDAAVLQAIGVNADGKREVIGVSVSTSEAEVHWRTFFTSLTNRGLHGVKLIVSDDHAGMKAARIGMFATRCVCYWSEKKKHKDFAEWLENNAEESMTYFDFNKCYPNEAACERLIGSLLMEQHEEWMEEKAYLTEKEAGKSAFCA